MAAAYVELHLGNRILLSFHKVGYLSVPEQLFLRWSWKPPQTHMEVTDKSFTLQGEAKL